GIMTRPPLARTVKAAIIATAPWSIVARRDEIRATSLTRYSRSSPPEIELAGYATGPRRLAMLRRLRSFYERDDQRRKCRRNSFPMRIARVAAAVGAVCLLKSRSECTLIR